MGSGEGVVAMSACMSGARGSGVLSNTADVLLRGVGGVSDMCMCLARGGVGEEGGEWMRELGLGFTNPVGTGGVLDMCLCFGCGCGWCRGLGPGSGAVGWCYCYVCVRCESGFSVWMAGPGICVLCLADTCTYEVHPVFNPVGPYGYLFSDIYYFN